MNNEKEFPALLYLIKHLRVGFKLQKASGLKRFLLLENLKPMYLLKNS